MVVLENASKEGSGECFLKVAQIALLESTIPKACALFSLAVEATQHIVADSSACHTSLSL